MFPQCLKCRPGSKNNLSVVTINATQPSSTLTNYIIIIVETVSWVLVLTNTNTLSTLFQVYQRKTRRTVEASPVVSWMRCGTSYSDFAGKNKSELTRLLAIEQK